MLLRSVAASRAEEAAVEVKTEIMDTQEMAVAGPSSPDAAFVEVYSQRSGTKPTTNWTGKADRLSCGATRLFFCHVALTTLNLIPAKVTSDSEGRS
jgi:hypothetical protein